RNSRRLGIAASGSRRPGRIGCRLRKRSPAQRGEALMRSSRFPSGLRPRDLMSFMIPGVVHIRRGGLLRETYEGLPLVDGASLQRGEFQAAASHPTVRGWNGPPALPPPASSGSQSPCLQPPKPALQHAPRRNRSARAAKYKRASAPLTTSGDLRAVWFF